MRAHMSTTSLDEPSVDLAALAQSFKPGLVARVQSHLSSLGLPLKARSYVMRALQNPSRRVRSTRKSGSGSYPSRKMGVTIGFESLTIEFPMVIHLEFDSEVLAYVDQPPQIKIAYRSGKRTKAYNQTPDFLVIRRGECVLVECKPLAKIHERNEKDPGFYVKERGRWVCPAAQDGAAEFSLSHEMWTEADFNRTRHRNLMLVGDYLTASMQSMSGCEEANAHIAEQLQRQPKISISQLLRNSIGVVTVDHLYRAIACGEVTCDIDRDVISDHEACYLYRDDAALQAYLAANLHGRYGPDLLQAPVLRLAPGASCKWDGVTWEICNLGDSQVTLQAEGRLQSLPALEFHRMATEGLIGPATAPPGLDPQEEEVQRRIDMATPAELSAAVQRMAQILPYLDADAAPPQERTARRYLAQYRAARTTFGNGFLGLLPAFSRCGNRAPRLDSAVLDIVRARVSDSYETPINKHIKHVHGLIISSCEAKGLPAPSYGWFCKWVKQLPAFRTKLNRGGAKAAYPLEARRPDSLDFASPRPDRAWANAHIDHTEIDVELVHGSTGKPLGRAWLTVLIDHNSLRILAFHLSFDPPSYRSVLMVLRDCVRRFGRLPAQIVVDGGKEFHGTWFAVTCARYSVIIVYRPPTKARFGSQIERLFGTANTNFFHALRGNTQLRKRVREMTRDVDPDVFAVWTLPHLNIILQIYFFDVYDRLEGRGLMASPREVYEASMLRHGHRPHNLITYDDIFKINTCPSTLKGRARVQPDGVKINYFYYNSPTLQQKLGQSVPVRYDPMDANRAFAQVDGKWERLKTRHEHVLTNRTEREVELASEELRTRRASVEKRRLTDTLLINFLIEIDKTEVLLKERMRANEIRRSQQANAAEDIDFEEVMDSQPDPKEEEPPPTERQTKSNPTSDDEATAAIVQHPPLNFTCLETF